MIEQELTGLLPKTGDVMPWLRENLGSAGVTETERQAMKDVVTA